MNVIQAIWSSLMLIVMAVFQSLRVYAIGGQIWYSAVIVLVLGLFPFSIDLFTDAEESYAIVVHVNNIQTCGYNINISVDVYNRLLYVSPLSVIVTDMIVLGITWYQTYTIRKLARASNIETPLATLLISDGTLYFVVLLILRIVQTVVNESSLSNEGTLVTYVSTFSLVFPSILISRFCLNLRQVSRDEQDNHSQHHSAEHRTNSTVILSTLRFTRAPSSQFVSRVVGDMAAPLEHGFEAFNIDEEGEAEIDYTTEDTGESTRA